MGQLRFLVVAYDVASDRRRRHLVKFLEDFGRRVNFSVFEVEAAAGTLAVISSGIAEIINRRKDCVLIYDLCGLCGQKKICLGSHKAVDKPAVNLF